MTSGLVRDAHQQIKVKPQPLPVLLSYVFEGVYNL